MNRHEIKKERIRIMAEITRLNHLSDTGEDVQAELLARGNELSNIGKGEPRMDVMDADNPREGLLITKEMKEQAMRNGIPLKTLENRIYWLKWEKERAVTEVPPKRIKHADIGLTIEKYKHLRGEGMSDVEIQKKFNITKHSLSKFKGESGLTKKQVMV